MTLREFIEQEIKAGNVFDIEEFMEKLHSLNFEGEEEIEPLMKDLDSIVSYISQLNELDTDGVEPTYQCFDMQNVWREDEIQEFEAKREDLLALAPESEDNQIKVPKVL